MRCLFSPSWRIRAYLGLFLRQISFIISMSLAYIDLLKANWRELALGYGIIIRKSLIFLIIAVWLWPFFIILTFEMLLVSLILLLFAAFHSIRRTYILHNSKATKIIALSISLNLSIVSSRHNIWRNPLGIISTHIIFISCWGNLEWLFKWKGSGLLREGVTESSGGGRLSKVLIWTRGGLMVVGSCLSEVFSH